jgi:hypothetical protein
MVLRTLGGLVVVFAVGAAGGCARPQARTEPERPPLNVPEPPPRSIAPVEPEEPAEPVVEAVASPTTSRPARRTPPARPAVKPDTSKEDAVKADAAIRPEDAVEKGVSATEGTPPLRTPQTANQAEVQRKVRELLARADRTLKGVNYSALNADAKSQYDTAKRFIQQADAAVKGQNFVFASYLADKADTLARGLIGR